MVLGYWMTIGHGLSATEYVSVNVCNSVRLPGSRRKPRRPEKSQSDERHASATRSELHVAVAAGGAAEIAARPLRRPETSRERGSYPG